MFYVYVFLVKNVFVQFHTRSNMMTFSLTFKFMTLSQVKFRGEKGERPLVSLLNRGHDKTLAIRNCYNCNQRCITHILMTR